ncbi:MAG: DSD1 family PLP-dependent enzyme [Clostridiaceae bacterium]|nr:DSD1 family PLP-dependent enzyme [Clostridiaceae bacterium]
MYNSYLIGLSEKMIPTPALVLDADTFEKNIKVMMNYLAQKGVNIRPHTKTHKTPMIARQQIKSGAIGLCCATIGEAEAMANSGLDHILIANEVIGEDKIRRVVSLARYVDIMVAVDSLKNLNDLSEAASAINVSLGVLVEIDVGMGRCGVRSIDAGVKLAKKAAELKGIRFRGVMGYEGHVVFIQDREERTKAGRTANARLVELAEAIRNVGIPVEIVSGAGTGSFDIAAEYRGITEIQAGSYIFMDLTYAKIGIPFEQSLTVLATVVSRPDDDTVIMDCGMKAISAERECPKVADFENLEVLKLAEEHTKAHLTVSGAEPMAGEKLHLIPSHCCSTVNLHDKIYVVRSGRIEAIWPVAGRGAY